MSLRDAASFYSDGADPRLFRVVTKPAARCRAGAEGGRGSLYPKTPRPLVCGAPDRYGARGLPGGRGWVIPMRPQSPQPRRPELGDLPPGAGCGKVSPTGQGVAAGAMGKRTSLRPRQLMGSGEGCRGVRPGRLLPDFGSAGLGAPGRFGSRVSAAGRGGPGGSGVHWRRNRTGGFRAPGCNGWAWLVLSAEGSACCPQLRLPLVIIRIYLLLPCPHGNFAVTKFNLYSFIK